MKRIIKIICALALALTIALGCVACGGGSNGETQKTGLGYEVDRSKMFGICVLPSDLPTSSKDPGITTEIVCDLIQTMNIKSVRVWMHIPYVLERVGYTNELRLKESTVQVYHDYFAALDEAGVENILVMSHQYLYPVEMIPQPTYNGVVPDPVTDPVAYQAFLDMFRNCYDMLAEEFPEITLWEPNNETDHPSGTTIVREGYVQGGGEANDPYLYSMTDVARITADLCYYANLGIKKHNPENELVMPGLVFSSTAASAIFIDLLYEQIESGELPFSEDADGNRVLPADTNTDNYFNVLNWHPYANIQPNDDWLQANIDMYNVAVEHGDGGKKLFLSEFGWYDSFDETRQNKIGLWYPEALDLLQENLPSLEAVYCFRMFNWTTTGEGVKDMEKTFGIFTSPVEESGITPKPAALSLFKYFNGDNADTSGLYKYAADAAGGGSSEETPENP